MKDTRQSVLPSPEADVSKTATPPTTREFQALVLNHYREHGRDLVWRKTTDPYCILVSEIMLQQTQVDRVALKYPAFIATFPDFSSLASAPLDAVLGAWQGMGYNRRAIALQKTAGRVVAEFDGNLPADVETLATFPGIGKATASSICAFAFNLPVIFIETNIRRVFIHFFFPDKEAVTDAELLPLVEAALFREDPRTWYNALMDFGTDLKTVVENPNRRSRHYSRQSAFEGSDRQIRGEILRVLLAEKQQTRAALISRFPDDPDRIIRILSSLETEGFIKKSGSHFIISSH
jgi:A/G-specific adenine glycosylase